jgi:hypothetical protein
MQNIQPIDVTPAADGHKSDGVAKEDGKTRLSHPKDFRRSARVSSRVETLTRMPGKPTSLYGDELERGQKGVRRTKKETGY